jgi:hypothetical protein
MQVYVIIVLENGSTINFVGLKESASDNSRLLKAMMMKASVLVHLYKRFLTFSLFYLDRSCSLNINKMLVRRSCAVRRAHSLVLCYWINGGITEFMKKICASIYHSTSQGDPQNTRQIFFYFRAIQFWSSFFFSYI